ncbi:hypothetical protein [Actinophytocola sp.]|uniref:hypothetical protein n=1 Tax=Actinophytocola sp. TaxID=1872138 RepID=UPI003D6AD256
MAVYVPTFTLTPELADALGSPIGVPVSAPDEDPVTMLWEVFDAIGPASGDETVMLAGSPSDLEPRAVLAHLIASGVTGQPSSLLAASSHMGPAAILAALKDLDRPATAGIVDRTRQSPVAPPHPELSIALRTGEPRIAEITACSTRASLTFDRWADLASSAGDDRFVETALQTEATILLDELLKEAGRSKQDLAGVIISTSHRLRTSALAARWEVREVVQPRASPHGAAAVLRESLRRLAEAGVGATLAVLDLGWGVSGAVLTAGRDVARAAASTEPGTTGTYDYREWTTAILDTDSTGPWTSPQELRRDAPLLLGRAGYKCLACQSVGFPSSHVCERCGKSTVISETLARTGTVFTHTIDHLYDGSKAIQMVVLDMDGGGRFYSQAAKDVGPALGVGDRAGLVLRLVHRSGDLPHYFWKVKHGTDG